ncbi:hypothetical protein ACE6H2_024960 [Prunus campanulata]
MPESNKLTKGQCWLVRLEEERGGFLEIKFGWKIVVGSIVGFFGAALGSVGGGGGGGKALSLVSYYKAATSRTSWVNVKPTNTMSPPYFGKNPMLNLFQFNKGTWEQ